MSWQPVLALQACLAKSTKRQSTHYGSWKSKALAIGGQQTARFKRLMIRFEILLPLFYNDGRPIEREKFLATDDELVHYFGATSTDIIVVRGR